MMVTKGFDGWCHCLSEREAIPQDSLIQLLLLLTNWGWDEGG